MNKTEYADYRAHLNVCAAILEQYEAGEYDTDAHPEIASVITELAEAMALSDDWEHSGEYGQRIALLQEWPRFTAGSNGKS